jgi:hypothetical protein
VLIYLHNSWMYLTDRDIMILRCHLNLKFNNILQTVMCSKQNQQITISILYTKKLQYMYIGRPIDFFYLISISMHIILW